ncbi:uncharacterized protein [Ptychodera flava]|uniref:uncharacterized protein n=1 Tax=Ptychodera flava TaxID=63121 RepID=UPI00396A9EB5
MYACFCICILFLASGAVLVTSQDYLMAWDPCGGCLHGGTCVEYAHKCLCPSSYYGNLCQERNPCPSHPIGNPNPKNACGGCQNGGVCVEAIGVCICHDNYFGKNCEQTYTTQIIKTMKLEGCKRYCDTDNDCLHGGRCLDTAKCECTDGYFGKTCESKEDWWSNAEESRNTDTVGVILASVPAVLITTVILPAAACFYCVVLRRSANQGSVINDDIQENSEEDIINIEGDVFPRHHYEAFDDREITESTRIAEDFPPMYGSQDHNPHTCERLTGQVSAEDEGPSEVGAPRCVVLTSPPSYDNMSPPDYESADLPPPYQSRLNTPSSDVTPPPPYEE